MNYIKLYQNLCSKPSNDSYTEQHHILPRCLNGSNDATNLVRLSAKGHYLAHWLLCKIYPDNHKIMFAFNMMSRVNETTKRNITAKQFEIIKKYNSKALSILHKGRKKPEGFGLKVSARLKGKKKSPEHNKKVSEAKKGIQPPHFAKLDRSKIKRGPTRSDYVAKWHGNAESAKKTGAKLKIRSLPQKNILKYKILTPTGFQNFEGIKISGVRPCLKFKTTTQEVIVSKKHIFDSSSKIATDYKIGDTLNTINGLEVILSIENIGSRQVFDILEVENGNLYIANGIQHHNCEKITDKDSGVIPEFTDAAAREIVKVVQKPNNYDAYVSMDPGTTDNTGILFGYMHPELACLVIEDEYLGSSSKITSEDIASAIKSKESEHFLDRTTQKSKVYLRISDNDPILINDMNRMHGLNFIPTRKDNKDAAVNDLRIKVDNRKIIINPRCKNLIAQMKDATWNKSRTSFTRDKEHAHYDVLDALIYMVRMVQWNKLPKNIQEFDSNDRFYNNTSNLTPSQASFAKLFTKRKY